MIPHRRKKPRRVDRERCPAHLQWVRGFECCGRDGPTPCDGAIEAHHVRLGSYAGLGIKPADDRAIPLCHSHHMLLDSPGWSEARFYREYDIPIDQVLWWFVSHSPPLRRRRAA